MIIIIKQDELETDGFEKIIDLSILSRQFFCTELKVTLCHLKETKFILRI